MIGKWIGALLIVAGCGAVGFSVASNHRRTEAGLRQLLDALMYMESELNYRLTPLPDLCRSTGNANTHKVGQAFIKLSTALNNQSSAHVSSCVEKILLEVDLPKLVQEGFRLLGTSLGRFDLEGQVKGIQQVQDYCRRELETMGKNREERLRSYQTLGLCAGAALAILFV